MSDNIKVLILSPYLPAIDTSACARKIYDSIVLLHQRGHSLYLFSFCSQDDRGRIDKIKPYCAQVHLEYLKDYFHYPYSYTSIRQKVSSICNNEDIDILQCEKAYMARYLPGDIDSIPFLVEHEILSVSFAEKAKLENNFINKLILLARKTKKRLEEKNWYRKFRKIIVFSEEDREAIYKLYRIDKEGIEVIPLGINLREYTHTKTTEKHYDLIFVGNFSHFPNTDAVLYFYREILPLIKKSLPHISLAIVGSSPPESIRRLTESDRSISVTGYVENIAEIYLKSKIFISPIHCGGGMRYKILEAMALGIPVVSTSVGARGILKENIKIADRPKEFADSVIELLLSEDNRAYQAENARLTIEKHYNLDVLLDRYENVYYDLLR
jgi:glycosyltransferase involved in cell wall biosynthesis